MFVDWDPDLKSMVGVLTVDLVQVKPIVHALLHTGNVLVVANFKPVVEHGLDPALAMQQIKTNLTAEEFGHKQVTLPLKIVDDIVVHLLK